MNLSPEELYEKLVARDYPDPVRISACAVVTEAKPFLEVQLLMIQQCKGDYRKSPAWQRLLAFDQATQPG